MSRLPDRHSDAWSIKSRDTQGVLCRQRRLVASAMIHCKVGVPLARENGAKLRVTRSCYLRCAPYHIFRHTSRNIQIAIILDKILGNQAITGICALGPAKICRQQSESVCKGLCSLADQSSTLRRLASINGKRCPVAKIPNVNWNIREHKQRSFKSELSCGKIWY